MFLINNTSPKKVLFKNSDRYVQVEYIGAVGDGAEINLGIQADTVTRFVITGSCAPDAGQNTQLLGTDAQSATTFFGARVVSTVENWYCRKNSVPVGNPRHKSTIDCTITSTTVQTGTLTDLEDSSISDTFDNLANGSWAFLADSLKLFGGYSTRRSPNAKCYELKIYTSDGLIRDLIPIYDNIEKVFGMYDSVSKQFFWNTGEQGTALVGPTITCRSKEVSFIKKSNNILWNNIINNRYKCVEYLQGDGNAYIDLGFPFTEDHSIQIKMKSSSGTGAMSVCGSRSSATSNNIALLVGGSQNILIDFNNSDYVTYRISDSYNANTEFEIFISKSKRKINEVVSTVVCNDTITTANNAYLFYISGSPASTNKFTGRIYGCKIWYKNILACHLIPVFDIINREYCMYDLVSGQVFGNIAGSGAFTGGLTSTIDGYTVLDYITFTGETIIDTGKTANLNSKAQLVYSLNEATPTGNINIFGASSASDNQSSFYSATKAGSLLYAQFDTVARTVVLDPSYTLGTITTCVLSKDGWYQDGRLCATFNNATSFTTPVNIYLGKVNGRSLAKLFNGNMYHYTLWNNDEIVQHLIPVYDSTNNVYGMYDIVANQFLPMVEL